MNYKKSEFNTTLLFFILTFLLTATACSDDKATPDTKVAAAFSSDVVEKYAGESINFIDESTGDPVSWTWTFEGGTPASSNEQNPIVSYSTVGTFDVSLTVTNQNSEDSHTKTDFITINCECSAECTESCSSELLSKNISVDGENRFYDVFLPSLYNTSTSDLPVILDLHGLSSNRAEQRQISNFGDLADEKNIIMVWPEALASGANCLLNGVSGKYWNANWGIETDDIKFIDMLIDQLTADYRIDSKRIYVTGLSNGGFMVYSIACALSERIAAVVSVAGSMTDNLLNTDCQPTRQLPVMHVHGTDDAVIFWDGEPTCQDGIAAINDVVSFWRTNAGCSNTFSQVSFENINTSDGSSARMISYDNCDGKINFLVVDNGGHNWPGSAYQINQGFSILQPINKDIVTNELIWEFFSQHQLP